jgi:cysteinyl-tRNA synthetase
LSIDEEFNRIANQRKEARAKKDYSKADQLRTVLIQNGFEVFDLPSGQQLLLNTNFV